MLETIITILGSSTITAVVTTLINRKSLTIQNNKDNDAVLINRLTYANENTDKYFDKMDVVYTGIGCGAATFSYTFRLWSIIIS